LSNRGGRYVKKGGKKKSSNKQEYGAGKQRFHAGKLIENEEFQICVLMRIAGRISPG